MKMPLTIAENGYTCGWLDADGCFSIYKRKQKRRIGFTLTPSIKIANNDKKVVLWFIEKFEITNKPYPKELPNGKISWGIDIVAYDDLFRILTMLDLDQLITKKEEAKILLKFVKRRIKRWQEFVKTRNRHSGRFGKEDKSFYGKEDFDDYKKIRELKRTR